MGSIPGSGRSLGERNGNPLQYSCLENPTNRGAWWATVHGVTKSQTRLSTHSTAEKCFLFYFKGGEMKMKQKRNDKNKKNHPQVN